MIIQLLLLGILLPLDVAQAGELEPWQAEGFGDKLEFSAHAADLEPVFFQPIQGDRTVVLLTEPNAGEGTVHPQSEIAQGDPATAPEGMTPRQGTPLHRGIPGEQPFIPQRIPFRPRTDVTTTQSKPYAASPAITVMTPSGYGAGWGSAGFGLGLQERTRFTDSSDGVAGFGIGFGNPRENIGLTVGVTVTDLWGDAFEDGSVSLKLHRQLPNDFGIAAGVQGALTWGETDGGTSGYGVVTKRFILDEPENLWSQVYLTLGVGGGQYRSESDIEAGEGTVGLFGSVALRVAPPVSAIAEWTGQDLTLGLSVVPFRNIPLVISPAITDITGSAGDGTRFILGIGYGFTFDRF
ncbi:hypothetical protein [Oscillatoria acuminata]|nr:hypothetical protein [Oscillatoria acuminata]